MNENETLTVDEVLDAAASSTETIEEVEAADLDARLIMDTPFDEYTVTEGYSVASAISSRFILRTRTARKPAKMSPLTIPGTIPASYGMVYRPKRYRGHLKS